MLTYAPCHYYTPSRNRRGGFHIRPCCFPVIAHLTAKFVGAASATPRAHLPCKHSSLSYVNILNTRFVGADARIGPQASTARPYNHRTFSNNQKRCMRQPGPCTFLFFRYSRQASTNARKILWLSAACQRCSGCHCTACTKRYSGRYTASISPSGATACARSAGASALMP